MKLPHKHYKNDDKIDFLLEEEKASDIWEIQKDYKFFGFYAIEKNA